MGQSIQKPSPFPGGGPWGLGLVGVPGRIHFQGRLFSDKGGRDVTQAGPVKSAFYLTFISAPLSPFGPLFTHRRGQGTVAIGGFDWDTKNSLLGVSPTEEDSEEAC